MVEIAEGQILEGKYRVDRVIGRGGMGIVVAARHLVLDETVAIKFLTEEALASEEAVARFEREARAAVKIKNEHVVRVFDVGRLASGLPYMVMEYLEGEDLAKRVAQGPLPVALAVDFVLQACVAIAGAHAAGIVHRDIKPGNLFCQQGVDGQVLVKVLDFGISKLAETGVGQSGMSVTKTSAVMGSPLYMSPEQIQNSKDVDARTDIWALGVVLFELVSGTVPFRDETFGAVAVKIVTQPTPPLAQFRRDVPPGLDAVIARCLTKDRNQRLASVAELARALEPFASRRGLAASERISSIVSASSPSLRGPASAPLPASTDGRVLVQGFPETAPPWSNTSTSRGSRRAIVGSVAALALGLAGLAFVLLRPGVPVTALPSSTPGSAEVAPPPTVAPSPPSVLPVAPEPIKALPSAQAPEVAIVPSPDETAPPQPATRTVERVERPLRPATTAAKPARDTTSFEPERAPTATRAPAPAPSPAATKPDCDPPYTLDDQGRKKFKRECFLK